MILLTLILIIKVLIIKNKETNNTKTTTLLLTCVVILTTIIEIIKALIITKIIIIVIMIIEVVNKILITCESENGDMQYGICKLRLSEIIVKITGIYQLRGTFISGTDKWEMPNLLTIRPIKTSILEVAYLFTMLH